MRGISGLSWQTRALALIVFTAIVTMVSRAYIGILLHDQAELIIYTQTLSWTYDEQMPVLTWLMIVLMNATGYFILIPDLVKYAGVIATVLLVFRMTEQMTGSPRAGFIAAMALFLIPTMNEDMLREYTHTAALIAFVAGSFHLIVTRRGAELFPVLPLLALVWAGGLMSKYTMLVIMISQIAALWAAGLADRRMLIRLGLTAAGAIAIAAPVYLLILLNLDPVQEGASEFIGVESPWRRLTGLLDLILSFLTEGLFLLIGLWIAWAKLGKGNRAFRGLPEAERFLLASLGATLALFAILILITNADVVRDRWLAPSLMMTAPLLAAWLARGASSRTNLFTAGFLALWLAVFALVRATEPFIDGASGDHSIENYPLIEIADRAAAASDNYDAVLTDNNHLAATMKVHHPRTAIYTPLTEENLPQDAAGILIVSTPTVGRRGLVFDGSGWSCMPQEDYTAPLRFTSNAILPYDFQYCRRSPTAPAR